MSISQMNTKIVYVTGCLGFMGFYVARRCLEQGWHVMGVDKMTYAANPDLLERLQSYPKFKFIKQDIADLDHLYDCDYVINTAAESHVDNSIVSSDAFVRSNVSGVHNLLTLIRSKSLFNMPTLIHFSTDEVYGDIEKGSHSEKDLLKPSNPYSATKAAGDMLILAWHRTYGVPFNMVRPTNNYGIGQYPEKLVPKTCKFLQLGRKIPLHNGGKPRRTWLHAKDTANAVLAIINSGVQNEIFNISGNYEDSNLTVVKKILKAAGKDGDIEQYVDFGFSREGQDVRYSIDDTKLRNLGWDNEKSFDEEIGKIVKYYTSNFIW